MMQHLHHHIDSDITKEYDMIAGMARRKAYHVVRRIGEGTYGVVSECVELSSGFTYAMKSICKKRFGDNSRIADFARREIEILETLPPHPNIIHMKEWFETSEKFYMVFELATGGELFDRIAKKEFYTEAEAADVIFELLHGLSHLHKHNIVHRDIKPENILYKTSDDASTLLLADFGVSNFSTEQDLPAYAAPEVISGSGHGLPADMWAVGVVTFTMLMGFGPWCHCQDNPSLYQAILTGNWKFESPYADNISDLGKRFIRNLMQVDPDLRPESSIAILDPWLLTHSRLAQNFLNRSLPALPVPPKPLSSSTISRPITSSSTISRPSTSSSTDSTNTSSSNSTDSSTWSPRKSTELSPTPPPKPMRRRAEQRGLKKKASMLRFGREM
ncbi:kinase-like domain-containing protein [Chytridium lagenaria]|nr:kinase-like domain-containing protein [Chytridium lagenaria]